MSLMLVMSLYYVYAAIITRGCNVDPTAKHVADPSASLPYWVWILGQHAQHCSAPPHRFLGVLPTRVESVMRGSIRIVMGMITTRRIHTQGTLGHGSATIQAGGITLQMLALRGTSR